MGTPRQSVSEPGVARRVLPYAAAGVLMFATLLLPPRPVGGIAVVLAAVLIALVMVAALLVPWARVPAWAQIVPAIVSFLAIALVRHAAGGTTGGVSAMALLPVIWLAVYSSVVQLGLGLVAMAATFIVPLVTIGAPTYGPEEWRRTASWLIVGAVVGVVVQRLVAESRARALETEHHAHTLATVAETVRRIGVATDARVDICDAAIVLADADFSVLMEPDGPSHLAITAMRGVEMPYARVMIGGEPSGAVVAYNSGERFFVPDGAATPAVSRRLSDLTGAVSTLYEPVRRGDDVAAVLVLGWRRRIDSLPAPVTTGIALLADEVAVVLERADLLAQLEALSRTDALTGLPNRRDWVPRLEQEIARASRDDCPLTVALLDLDLFKRFNDAHGHQAGDRLLKAAAAAWRSHLREVDLLGRYGGEEFVIVLPGCAPGEAAEVLERLRAATPGGVTSSVGAVGWAPGEEAETTLARADALLYEAKQAGRNRVLVR
jgi:diguanylate cyclase (GGDEF)-like protein